MSRKMNAMTKRWLTVGLAGLLTLCGMLSLCPVAALAEDVAVLEAAEDLKAEREFRTPTTVELEKAEEQQALWDELVAAHGPDVIWPLEVWAEYSRRCMEQGIVLPDDIVYGVPAADEVQLEQALETAGQHLLKTMGFQDGMLDRFSTYTKYFVTDPEKPYYTIAYNPKNAEEYEDIGAYFCIIDGKTGEVLEFLTPADAKG